MRRILPAQGPPHKPHLLTDGHAIALRDIKVASVTRAIEMTGTSSRRQPGPLGAPGPQRLRQLDVVGHAVRRGLLAADVVVAAGLARELGRRRAAQAGL